VATAKDGSVYAVDTDQIRQRVSDGVTIRTGSVQVVFSPAANEKTEEVVRGYRVRCGEQTAALHTTLSMERGTRRVAMSSNKIADLEYRPLDEMSPAERSAIDYICAAPL
jgi:hypothetical protein